jgi:hypothetical protein
VGEAFGKSKSETLMYKMKQILISIPSFPLMKGKREIFKLSPYGGAGGGLLCYQ